MHISMEPDTLTEGLRFEVVDKTLEPNPTSVEPGIRIVEPNFQSVEPNQYWFGEWSEPNLASVKPDTITEGLLFAVVHKTPEPNPASVEPDLSGVIRSCKEA